MTGPVTLTNQPIPAQIIPYLPPTAVSGSVSVPSLVSANSLPGLVNVHYA